MDRESKLKKLRILMEKRGVDAVIIPSTDPHSSEYVHKRWKLRSWITDFKGSAGTLVVTKDKAGLWTDFRYYIEAADVLKGSSIELYRQGLPETQTISEFIIENSFDSFVVGFDGSLFSTTQYEAYRKDFEKFPIDIDMNFDPAEIWGNRPVGPDSVAYSFNTRYCGESRTDKLSRVLDIMGDKEVEYYIISSLADIAWLFNIRGCDVDYTPLVMAYAVITKDQSILFIDKRKISNELAEELSEASVVLKPYDSIADYIVCMEKEKSVYYMPENLNCYLSGLIPEGCNIVRGIDITTDLKAVKNRTEISNIKQAMIKDGVALVRFFKYLSENIGKVELTEFSAAPILRECRLSLDGCVDESFAPIIGYRSNGALCHYSAEKESALVLDNSGLLLVDSGGQYLEGTTDITRTISLGAPTEDEKLHYTLVLKGHLKIGMTKFPEGTSGAQLDALAREPLWSRGLDYGHGTGHGVGFFLGVHEGPHNISPRSFSVPLKEGMITSNEPGLYIEGSHGIRIENLVLTRKCEELEQSGFLDFETLTLFPYDNSLIIKELLTLEEINWINKYHKKVFEKISPNLNNEEVKWLKERTTEI